MGILMLLLVIQGWILTFLFFTRKQNVVENRLLGGIVAFIALSSCLEIIETQWPLLSKGIWIYVFTSVKLLTPLFLYFYIRKTVDKAYSIPLKLYLIPVMVSTVFSSVYYVIATDLSFDGYVDSIMSFWFSGFNVVFWLIALTMAFKAIHQQSSVKAIRPEYKSWMYTLLLSFSFIILMDIVDDLNEHYNVTELDIFDLIDVILLVLIYFISYKVLSKPELFYQHSGVEVSKAERPKYHGSGVPQKRLEELRLQLDTYMREQQPYLKGDLTIQEVAVSMDVSRQYLSQVLSEKFGCNFNDYINRFRVEEFKRRAIDNQYKDYTILAMALDSGFNSKTSFNTIFKKHTGQTPSQFRNENGIKSGN
ncbi:MAG: helix-turn-helix domain-containing protein [Bacteroidales bacterium]|nr:helix-turn-helix domain-containing protein [Bacteroidales bacterium]